MEIKVALTNNLTGFNARDIRNFIGSIADEEHKDFFMYHGNGLSPVIYSKPFRNMFDIIFTKTNEESMKAINSIKAKLESGQVNVFGERIKNITIDYTDYDPIPIKETAFYKLVTPLVLAVNNTEFKILYNVSKKKDKTDFIRFITRQIISSLNYQIKEYAGQSISLANDLRIKVLSNSELKFRNIKYKDGVIVPAINMRFASNYRLPEFVGYKIGLGYGRLVNAF